MTEQEVNQSCYKWLIDNGYRYKGILNQKPNTLANKNGYGQVPVPDGGKQVLIDHQGVRDYPDIDLIWIEAKGSDVGMSTLLEGFARVGYACWCGGGKGLLAIPDAEYKQLLEGLPKGYLTSIAKASEKQIGLLNANSHNVHWVYK